MMKRIYLTPPIVKVLTATVVVLVCALLIYSMSGMPSPRESDRISTLDGSLSIIKPREWKDRILYGPIDQNYSIMIELEHAGMIGIPDKLNVSRLRKSPDLERLKAGGMVQGRFQDQDAIIYAAQLKHDFQWRAIFQREGQWYDISLRLQRKEDVPNSAWWAYLTSFKCRNVPAPASATEPSPGAPVIPQ